MTGEAERRGRRLPLNRRLFFFGEEEFEGEATVLDISTNGCRATSLTEVKRGLVLKLSLFLQDQQWPLRIDQAVVRSEELHDRLWTVAEAQAAKERTVLTSLFIQSLNEVIDLHATRLMAVTRSRVPNMIWIVLYLLAVIAMVMMGYHAGLSNSRRSIATVALVIGFSAVLYLIADLDRPGQGTLKISQQTMMDLRKSMQ